MRNRITHSNTKPRPAAVITRNFSLLFIAHFFFGLSFWPYVLLPVFLQGLGADLAHVGIMMGASSIAGILIRPWIGITLDRIGRKRCLLIGGSAFFLCQLLYLSVDQIGWKIYVIRLFHGFGMGILMATFFTFAADISPRSRQTEGIALFGISGHISGVLAVPLGEYLIEFGGYSTLFKTCAIFSFLSMMISTLTREPKIEFAQVPPRLSHFFKAIVQRPNRVPLAATFLFALGMTSYMVFLKPYAQSIGLNRVSSFFLAYSLTAMTIRLVGGKWPDRFGWKTILYPALFSFSIGIFLLVFQPSSAGLVLSGALSGIGHGFIFPILSVLLIRRAPETERGIRMTLFTLFFDIGILFGAPFWGLIAEKAGYETLFFFSAVVALSSWGCLVFLGKESSTDDKARGLKRSNP